MTMEMPDSSHPGWLQRIEVFFAVFLLVGSLIAWPITALTWAKDEPQFVLGLSWFAITLTALDLLKTSRVHRDQASDDSQ